MENNNMMHDDVGLPPKCSRVSQPSTPTSPSLNLMEQLLLAKMERHSLDPDINKSNCHLTLLRTNSVDSQTSASTFSSIRSADSTDNHYCKCDDCLLGIVDKHQRYIPTCGQKKVE